MSELVHPKIISGNSNITLSKGIASWASSLSRSQIDLIKGRVEQFNDQEIFVEVFENVRNEDMFIIQSTSNPANDNIMELLIIADALRRSSAKRITAVIPYFGYARQDRKVVPRTSISAKLVSNLITKAGADRVVTVDLHAGQIQGFFDITVDNLFATPIFARHVKKNIKTKNLICVAPDVGGVERTRALARKLDVGIGIIDKRRPAPGKSQVMNVIGNVNNKTCKICKAPNHPKYKKPSKHNQPGCIYIIICMECLKNNKKNARFLGFQMGFRFCAAVLRLMGF